MQEVFETYTDTWDKMVKVEILKQYTADQKTIFTMNPDFEEIDFPEKPLEKKKHQTVRDQKSIRYSGR